MDVRDDATARTQDPPVGPAADSGAGSPLATMWLHPGRSMRAVVGTGAELWAIPIAMAAGAAVALVGIDPRHAELAAGLGIEGRWVGLFVAGIGALGAALWVIIYGWLVAATGEWLGGKAGHAEAKVALGWSQLPGLLLFPVGVAILLFEGPVLLEYGTAPVEGFGSPLLALGGVLLMLVWPWMLVLMVGALREVQGFSTGRTLGNLLIASVAPVVGILVIVLAVTFVVMWLGG